MKSFSEELKSQNKQLGSNIKEYAPYSTKKYTNFKTEKRTKLPPLDLNKYKVD